MIEEEVRGLLLQKSGAEKSSYDFFAEVSLLTTNFAHTSEWVKWL